MSTRSSSGANALISLVFSSTLALAEDLPGVGVHARQQVLGAAAVDAGAAGSLAIHRDVPATRRQHLRRSLRCRQAGQPGADTPVQRVRIDQTHDPSAGRRKTRGLAVLGRRNKFETLRIQDDGKIACRLLLLWRGTESDRTSVEVDR